MTTITSLGMALQEARLAQNISIYRIAKDLHLSEATIKRCESGKGRMVNVVKMCEYLNVKPTIQ